VPGAPLEIGQARLDDGSDIGETLIMHGQVRDEAGAPIAGAIVDVWHANTLGAYSVFDPSQSPYNNRRRIQTGADGAYRFRSIVPKGYAVPPQGSTAGLLAGVGRHGRRPAHIHFFVSAPGRRHLTTQINIDGDPDLHDDFAYATRDGLIPAIVRRDEADAIGDAGLNAPFSEIEFDFVMLKTSDPAEAERPVRPRVEHG
jgi:catechol 1,2-dioxygenase